MSVSIGVYSTSDMGLRTPPPKSRAGKSKKKGQKGVVIDQMEADEAHGLLENYDLELEGRERQFRQHLQMVLDAFKLRQRTEIGRIPLKIRDMTIEQVEKHWGGSWAGTLGKMAEERQREEDVGEGEKERALREGVKGKRKRTVAAQDSSPERTNKNARKAPTPLKSRPGAAIPSSTSKRKLVKKAVPFVSANPTAKGPSSLPQNHIFNPVLPPTPLRKMNPTDVLLTVNGSPVVNPLSKSMRERQAESGPSGSQPPHRAGLQPPVEEDTEQDGSDDEGEHDSDEDDDLPDEKAYAAHILSQSQSQPSRSAPSRSKRQPSLLWREPSQADGIAEEPEAEAGGEKPTKAKVYLPDGKFIEFDPLALDRAVMNQELANRGLSAKQREEVGKLLQAEVVKALQSKMQSWC